MIGGASISGTSSSPGKAISPHTPHTPAIPSRLSANSIIDYSNRDTPNAGARRHRLSEQSHELTLEEASSDETTMEPPVSNAAAIDIPTSPPFVPNFGRSRSAAHQRRSSATADDEMGDFFFGMRSMSLGGADDRPPLSLSALLRRQDQDNPVSRPRPQEEEGVPPTDEPSPADAVTESRSSGPPSSPAGQSYQPRFPHPHVRGSTGRPQSRGSVSSSLGRGSALPSYVRDRERETGNDSGSNSGFSTTVGRRGSHRFSFTRNANFDEDEPLLFTMSDFGASRRSLEDARR
jgi:autophagy-related protein 13